MLDTDKIRKRWSQCWEAKQDELDRIEKSYLWMYEFERHLKRGEEGNEVYRFPEIMGYVLRRYNEYIKILPECRANGQGDSVIGLQAAVDHHKTTSNLEGTKLSVIADATAMGNGCLALMPYTWRRKDRKGKEWVQYSGMSSERVDWRHFFPAPGFKKIHDHTGQNACPYAFRRRIYHIDTFKEVGAQKKWKNLDRVVPTTWDNSNVWGDDNWTSPHETEEYSSTSEFVTVLEYWDIVNDEFRGYATGGIEIFVSEEGIPFKHKQLPFHHYRNVYRLDSINALGEIEINMPYNLFREKILNLAIDDVMMRVQVPMVVDGAIGFNTEEHELESGAIFTVRGVAGGKLQDHIMPLNFGGGVGGDVMNVIQMIENSRIAVTSDDTTSLYSNPNQLATQTLAKMQSLNKSIDGATKRNIFDAEYYLTNQMVSFIKNELAEPYKDGKETKFHKIKIKGYDVIQDGDESEVKFEKRYGAGGEFALNKETSKMFDESEVEIVSALKDEELKRDQTEKLTMMTQTLFQTIGTLAQVDPSMLQQVLGDMNVPELIKIQFKNLGLEKELKDIFPVMIKGQYELDLIDAENGQILAGITPEIREDEDSMEEYEKHVKFRDSKFFQNNADKEAKKAMKEHLIKTLKNAQLQNSMPVADRKRGLEGAKGNGGQQGVQGNAQLLGGQTPPGGANVPLQGGQGGPQQGIPGRPAQLMQGLPR